MVDMGVRMILLKKHFEKTSMEDRIFNVRELKLNDQKWLYNWNESKISLAIYFKIKITHEFNNFKWNS